MWQEHLAGKDIGFYQGRGGFDPARPSLLMIHGAGGRGEGFLPQLSGLEGINVASLDLPGHRQTPGPGRRRVEDYADWLAAFLAAGPLRPVLLGHSMGGAIAMSLALSHPQLLRGGVLMGTGPRLPVNPALLRGILENFRPTVEQIVKWAYAPEADPALVAQGAEHMSQADPQVMHDDFVACDRFDITSRLGQIGLPCLILAGEHDLMAKPKLSQEMAAAIPGAELKIIAGAGHMLHLEKHREVNAALDEFVARF
jgi:pimeloyl-ACP methyl ester carboxylesterase